MIPFLYNRHYHIDHDICFLKLLSAQNYRRLTRDVCELFELSPVSLPRRAFRLSFVDPAIRTKSQIIGIDTARGDVKVPLRRVRHQLFFSRRCLQVQVHILSPLYDVEREEVPRGMQAGG